MIKTSAKTIFFLLACTFGWVYSLHSATLYHVKPGGNDGSSGTSWDTAFATFQKALDDSAAGDTIWVASGTYNPTYDYGLGLGDRGKHFRMKEGVAIYGGFSSEGNPGWADRDWRAYETILSGDIGVEGDSTDNCYHVLYHPSGTDLTYDAVLDGFTVTGGRSDYASAGDHQFGGGMFNHSSSPGIYNCAFKNNNGRYGAAMANSNSSNPRIVNCAFYSNTAGFEGGAMRNADSSPLMVNCLFSGNKAYRAAAQASYGGAVCNVAISTPPCEPLFINCVVSGNSANTCGGGMYNVVTTGTLTSPEIINSIVWGNEAPSGGNGMQIYNDSNSTVNISYSCYTEGTDHITAGGGFTPSNCITYDPSFIDQRPASEAPTAAGDYRLATGSPAIDVGDNASVPADVTTDLDGNVRINDTVDMGAYEWLKILSVSVDPSVWNIGNVGINSFIESEFKATNEGNINADFLIKSTDGDNGWLIWASPNPDKFQLKADAYPYGEYNIYVDKTDGNSLTWETSGGILPDGEQKFKLRYWSPTSDSKGGGVSQNFTVTITAVEATP